MAVMQMIQSSVLCARQWLGMSPPGDACHLQMSDKMCQFDICAFNGKMMLCALVTAVSFNQSVLYNVLHNKAVK